MFFWAYHCADISNEFSNQWCFILFTISNQIILQYNTSLWFFEWSSCVGLIGYMYYICIIFEMSACHEQYVNSVHACDNNCDVCAIFPAINCKFIYGSQLTEHSPQYSVRVRQWSCSNIGGVCVGVGGGVCFMRGIACHRPACYTNESTWNISDM